MVDNYYDISYFEELYKQEDPYHIKGNVRELFRFSQSLALLKKAHFKITLDLGTGEGFLLPKLVEFADMVVGIDCSLNALKRNKQLYGNKASLIVADIQKLPIKDGVADFLLCFETLCYLSPDEINQALKETNRIATYDAQLLFSGRRKDSLLTDVKQEFVVKKIKPASTYLIKVLKWFGPCRRLVHNYSVIKFLVFLGKIFPIFTNQLVILARKN